MLVIFMHVYSDTSYTRLITRQQQQQQHLVRRYRPGFKTEPQLQETPIKRLFNKTAPNVKVIALQIKCVHYQEISIHGYTGQYCDDFRKVPGLPRTHSVSLSHFTYLHDYSSKNSLRLDPALFYTVHKMFLLRAKVTN